jgi:hypothetical protein
VTVSWIVFYPIDAGAVLMHADNRRVDHLQSDIMGAQILSFDIQADIPQTKSILAKSSPWRSQS